LRETLSLEQLGEFSTRPQQTAVRAVFVPLELLQRELDQPEKVNTILLKRAKDSGGLSDAERKERIQQVLEEKVGLQDYNITLRPLEPQRGISIERTSTLLDDNLTTTASNVANSQNLKTIPVLSYVANGITAAERTIPYSLVTAIDDTTFTSLTSGQPSAHASGNIPI
jgi:hypothetical protein